MSDIDVKKQKNLMRQEYRIRRQSFVTNNLGYEEEIADLLCELIQQFKAPESKTPVVASYCPTAEEANPNLLFSKMQVYRWVLPKINQNEIEFHLVPRDRTINELETEGFLAANAYNILEPVAEKCPKISESEITHLLVPGVVFDRRGARIGMGKGFYDKALSRLNSINIGVATSTQIADEDLPTENHDQFLDFIVTEKYIIQPVEKDEV